MKQLGGRYWAGCESGHKASGLGQGWALISSFSFLDFCTQGFASCIILNAALSSCTRSHLLLNSIIWHTFSCTVAELGTRQYCRDNETVFSDHKVVCYCNIYYIWCGYSIKTPRPKFFSNFFWSLRLYYVVALSFSRSYTIAACPALDNSHLSRSLAYVQYFSHVIYSSAVSYPFFYSENYYITSCITCIISLNSCISFLSRTYLLLFSYCYSISSCIRAHYCICLIVCIDNIILENQPLDH